MSGDETAAIPGCRLIAACGLLIDFSRGLAIYCIVINIGLARPHIAATR